MTQFWLWFPLLLVAVLLGVDLCFKIAGRKTLSHTVYDASHRWPIIAFGLGTAVGLLAWHLFASNYGCAN